MPQDKGKHNLNSFKLWLDWGGITVDGQEFYFSNPNPNPMYLRSQELLSKIMRLKLYLAELTEQVMYCIVKEHIK
jgi:hypothetical protein